MLFSNILKSLPNTQGIKSIKIGHSDGSSELIENRPGKSGSVAVYNALYLEFSELNSKAAEKGIELFAEHSDDARSHPGNHPNIDRLFTIQQQGLTYKVEVIKE